MTTLVQAREQARTLIASLIQGMDPREEAKKAQERAAAQAITFREALEQFLAKASLAPATHKKYLQALITFRDQADLPLTWWTQDRVVEVHAARSRTTQAVADHPRKSPRRFPEGHY